MNTNCSICNDYLMQLRRASAKHDEENYRAIKALYLQHLNWMHPIGKAKPINRDTVRSAFGKWGE